MNFREEFRALKADVEAQTPKELQEKIDQLVVDLKAGNTSRKSVGDIAPDFRLKDPRGKYVSLKTALQDGPVVLNFYRGGWCPFCNLELNTLQRTLPKFKDAGAQLIAISPESPDNSLSTIEKHKLAFSVLSDINSTVARQYGIIYQVPSYLVPVYEKFGVDIKRHNASDALELPLPATYVVDTDQKIIYAFANEDYTVRADIQEILQVLNGRLKR
ncbi:peroxiredoxin-like family protein [Dawidia soli]|uniref:thioredoxin-dependent peroxiredoxin n=1 Tax=Dawidia soli TaxID=2782352 RepID=A0AAP2GDL5_9BACT|nr:peroxiredoxin-like family protein [Dawidia soli]MBT1687412.1 AhpC/TSA family protein [Dawidia soli]